MIDFNERRRPPILKENGYIVSLGTCAQQVYKIHHQFSPACAKTTFKMIKTCCKSWMTWRVTWNSNCQKYNNFISNYLRLTFNKSLLCEVIRFLPCQCRPRLLTSNNTTPYSQNLCCLTICKALILQVQTNRSMTLSGFTTKGKTKQGLKTKTPRRKQWQT